MDQKRVPSVVVHGNSFSFSYSFSRVQRVARGGEEVENENGNEYENNETRDSKCATA
jgi:hypothetical protein